MRSKAVVLRLATTCLAVVFLGFGAGPAGAATTTKTWSFATTAEGYSSVTGNQSIGLYDGGTGNPPGALYTEISGRNKTNSNYWEWTGTFEDMGVPAGATVSAIQLVGGFTRCTVYSTGASSTAGPWELRDAGGNNVLATVYTGRTFTGTDGAWVAATGASQSLADLASNTTVRIRLNNDLATGGSNQAAVRLYDDQVSVQLTYTTAGNTTTLGNNDGTFTPAAPTICPGQSADVNAFTLVTDGNSDAVNDVTVTVANPAALASVQITTDGGSVLGTANAPISSPVTIPVSGLTATASLAQYRVRVTAKAHGDLPAPPDQSYAITATVTGFTPANNAAAGSDTASDDTVTIDNASPGQPTLDTCTGVSASQIDLTWTNPGDQTGIIVVRGPAAGACPTFAPSEGLSYGTGPQGSDQIIFSGSGSSVADTGLGSDTSYCYEIWARDDCQNWSQSPPSSTTCSTQAAGNITTLGDNDGSFTPTAPTICAGEAADVDAFTLVTDGNNDPVTGVTVTVASPSVLASVQITTDGGSVLGTASAPISSPVTVPVSGLTATASLTQYRVKVTAKTQAGLPAPPDQEYAITATVTDIVPDTNGTAGSDATSDDTVTLDNQSPGQATFDSCVGASSSQISLGWTNPGDESGVLVVRGPAGGACPTFTPTEGTPYGVGTQGSDEIIFAGAGASTTDGGLLSDTSYCYEVWTWDNCDNYSQTPPDSTTCATLVTQADDTTVGVPTALVNGCNQITVSAPFTGDGNGDGATVFERGPTSLGPWTEICAGVTGSTPRQCIDSSVAENSIAHYRVSFTDPDGVVGTNPQVTGPHSTPFCYPETTVVANNATVSSCRQITVDCDFTGDGNGDGVTLVEVSPESAGTWTTVCSSLTGVSPRQCLVTGLDASTGYDLRVTYSDPDGFAGVNPSQEVLAGITTSECGVDIDAPTLLVVSPARGSIVGGPEKVKVQVFDGDGTLAALEWQVDGGGYTSFLAGVNSKYDCGVGCAVYEFDLDTLPLSNGEHTIEIRATDDATPTANVATLGWAVTVSNQGGKPTGDGFLLRRSHGSQICQDCHNIPTHSSQYLTGKAGNWAIDCLTCHTPHGTTNIYLIRENLRTPNSGSKSVLFHFDDESGETNPGSAPGDYSFLGDRSGAQNAPHDDGICETCHTKTKFWRNDSSVADKTHSQNVRCSKCHTHVSGFTGGECNDCHNAPPTVGKHGIHDQVGTLPTAYEGAASHATATQYGFACAKCHGKTAEHVNDSTHAGTSGDPFQVEVVFDDSDGPKNPAGTYAGTYNESTDLGPSGEYWSWSNGTCDNLYCHSNADPLGGSIAYQSPPPTWDQAGSLTCVSCHDGASGITGLSAAHAAHVDPGTYTLGCVRCHVDTADSDTSIRSDNPSGGKILHVDGTKDVIFDASGPDNSGGGYDDVNHTCSNTYCHSDGQNATPPYTSGPSIAWDTNATCRSCHAGDHTGPPVMASGRHGAHVNNLTASGGVLGVNFECAVCHDATVSAGDNVVITGYGAHVNGSATVSGAYAGTWTDPTCGNSYCHSSGQDAAAPREYYNPSWDSGTLDCKGCHGRHGDNAFVSVAGEPNYTNGGAGAAKANSHAAHVSSALDCAWCHAESTTTGSAILAGSLLHTNGVRDVSIASSRDGNGGTGSDNYDGVAKTCSSVDCHPGQTVTWGDAVVIQCRTCHMASGAGNQDIDDYVYGGASQVARIDSEDWLAYGHGAASAYAETGNPGADFDAGGQDGCLYCHLTSVDHGDGGNPFRLANTAGGDGKNGNCLVCHKDNGDPGYDPGSGSINSDINVGTAHYGTRHGVGEGGEGGSFCWDCHDPHGDYNYNDTKRLANMIHLEPVQDHAGPVGWGIPTVLAPVPDFRADRDGAGGFDWGDYVVDTLDADAKYHGVCQVCHTQNSRFLQADISGYSFAQDATHFNNDGNCTTAGCHLHNNNFKNKGCNECHAAPPDPGPGLDAHTKHVNTGVVPNTYDNLIPSTTATDYGFPCAKCHDATHLNDTTATGTSTSPFFPEVSFDTTAAPANPGGTYTGQEVYPDAAVDQGPDGRYWSWTDDPAQGTCSNLYCHSNAAPSGGGTNLFVAAHWADTTPLGCTGCHSVSGRDETGGTATDLSQKHGKHLDATTYAISCDECHAATMQDDSSTVIGDKREHVDGGKDVLFSTTATAADSIDQQAGSFASGTCSNTYCHSQGDVTAAPFTAPNADPNWNTGTTGCDTCHGGDAAATFPMTADAHAEHINQAGYLGDDFMCYRCHQVTVSNAANDQINTFSAHVDGVRDVDVSDGGTWTGTTCSNSYCHSDGTETPGFATVPSWSSGVLANDCRTCHGTGSSFGEPDYANNTGSFDTRNSHGVPDHVASAADCIKCHASAVDASGALISSGTHLDAVRNVSNATFITTYSEATETCQSVCHGGNPTTWGDTLGCRSCHMASGAGNQDVNDYVWDNLFVDGTGNTAIIDGDDWSAYGHGRSGTNFQESGNPAAGFDDGGDGCLYCHTSGVGHNDGANPFRLSNTGGADGKNGNCLVCHKSTSTGFDPGTGNIDPTKKIDATHYGSDHPPGGAGDDGGYFCWDCHDPHGDYNYGKTQRLAYMIQAEPVEDHSGSAGWGIPIVTAPVPDFRTNRDGSAGWDWGDYVGATKESSFYRGVCQVCHESTARFWKTDTSGESYDDQHYPSNGRCTNDSCHKHDQPPDLAFAASGGNDCLQCHGTGTQGNRRAVTADFADGTSPDFRSHHVGSGSANTLQGTLTNFDCVVCHAEGHVVGGAVEVNTTYHPFAADTIDLRNADDLTDTGVFAYDKNAVWAKIQTDHGGSADFSRWNSGSGDDATAGTWVYEMKNNVDPFCLSCHDDDGASAAYQWGEPGATAGNPFNDNLITNNYDQMNRADHPTGLASGLVDVTSQVTATIDQDSLAARLAQQIADPPQGIFSRHAIRGQSLSVYENEAAGWQNGAGGMNYWNSTIGNPSYQWNDTSVMSCADCHTSDGANQSEYGNTNSLGNAHGSDSEYLLKDSTGGAAEGTFDGPGAGQPGYVCWLCHDISTYKDGTGHTANPSDFQDKVGLLGTARKDDGKGSSMFGMACTACHGGFGFGSIHGTSDNFVNGGGGTRDAYRFTNGGSLQFYDPMGWNGTQSECYTLNRNSGDPWGNCTQHSGGSNPREKIVVRELAY